MRWCGPTTQALWECQKDAHNLERSGVPVGVQRFGGPTSGLGFGVIEGIRFINLNSWSRVWSLRHRLSHLRFLSRLVRHPGYKYKQGI